MEYQYIVQSGNVKEHNSSLLFEGKTVEFIDPNTKATVSSPQYSAILFPIALKSGSLSFDIEFSNVCELTRCGFILNYSFMDGKQEYYQSSIRNQGCFCSLDSYNGTTWETLTGFGDEGKIEKERKYSLELTVKGNILSFSLNRVPIYMYSRLNTSNGVCGIYTYNESNSTVSNVHIMAEKPTAFSIMKFEKDFDELYQNVITPVCAEYGYKSLRADECYTSSAIIQDIIREIAGASLIIADITMDNPNVFYELGYAHALNKPTILLADINKRDRLPFDISGYRTVFYENSIGGKKEIEKKLRKYIENIHTKG